MRKPEEKKLCARPGQRWEDIIKWNCNEIRWVHFAQDRDKWQAVVNTVMNLQFPYSVGNAEGRCCAVLAGYLFGWKCV